MKRPHILCILLGHKWIERKETDFTWCGKCGRCKMWTYNFPESYYYWYHFYNGLLPEIKAKILYVWVFKVGTIFRACKLKLFPEKLPF